MALQPNGPAGTWSLAWNDEFDDTAGMSGPTHGLQTSKWDCGYYSGPSSPGVGNITAITDPVNTKAGEATYHGPASIVFPGDGAVHLRLQAGVDNSGSYNGRTVESGMITTAGLMNLNPGNVAVSSSSPDLRPYVINGPSVLEIKARFPGPNASAGSYWPIFYLTNAGNYGGANPTGAAWPGGQTYLEEIDLIEFYVFGSIGSAGRFNTHQSSGYGGMSSVPASMQSTDLSLAYHTYTYQFGYSSLQLWVDGIAVPGVAPAQGDIMAQWQYPQYVLIAFDAVAGASLPTTAASTPSDFMIDYVRVWNQTATVGSVFSMATV